MRAGKTCQCLDSLSVFLIIGRVALIVPDMVGIASTRSLPSWMPVRCCPKGNDVVKRNGSWKTWWAMLQNEYRMIPIHSVV